MCARAALPPLKVTHRLTKPDVAWWRILHCGFRQLALF